MKDIPSHLSMLKSKVQLVRFSVALLAVLTFRPAARAANATEGIALMIVYDTSGSMLQQVRDKNGQSTAKHVIASRALNDVLDRLQAAAHGPASSHPPLLAGLVVFEGDHAGIAVKLRPFTPEPFRAWLKEHGRPKRGTPLGEAVRLAGETVLNSTMPRKHVLVITDGINTQGPDPVQTIPTLQKAAESHKTNVSFHFVAFDIDAKEFAGVKRLGGTVLGAADEKQLNSQLEFILAKKILLEDEEAPSVKQN